VLEVEIGDDGIGFDSDQEPSSTPRSFGLSSIDPGRVNHRLVCRQRRHYLAVRPTRVPCRYGQPATWLATGPTVSVATAAASQRRRSWAQRRAGLESNGHGAPASWADPIEVRRRQTTHTPTVQTHDHQGLRVLTSDRPDAGTRRSTAS